MKTMEHKEGINSAIGFVFGAGGGIAAWNLQVMLDISFITKLAQTGAIALVSGFLGIAGKNLYLYLKRKWNEKK